ncbi:ATP-binding cassette domain-containing protein [Acidianus sulfidivorans JP7]|uniref:ABC transporter ATP-binding protein n=1 Tax=Acidianus sulfidivorans JP7 TaxID=619593 RepID=A0A2U9IK10_9CREN|nr:ATP-binding cassette domain-containing protein [Acidianus sulfidivorans]AWR96379.1 ATP-binding cassette domain-containing protein [Acidianus sulfidivorans JP7]
MLVINSSFPMGNIEIEKGEIVGLLGKNGSGKTTLIRSVLCENSNKIYVDDQEFCTKKDYSLISVVLQDPYSQILAETVKEEIELMKKFHNVNEEIAKKIMGDYYDKEFLKLSDGYKRRFVISTVLASNPRYILFDEPFANLDYEIINNIKEIMPKGSLIAEHRTKEIRDLIDRAYLIDNGKIREIEKEKLYDDNFLISKGLRGFKLEKDAVELGDIIFEADTKKAKIRVREREILCLVGKNGSGKTTTLKQLVGKIYVIFQNPDLQFFNDTVAEEIKDENAIELFKLKDYADKSPYLLSYGQKMRVLIASAYASKSRVIALDEPSVGMDGDSLLSFYEMIKLLREENRGIIIATHDEDLIGICDTIIKLD